MNFSKSINELRRNLMHLLTKNIGNSHLKTNFNSGVKPEIKRVLISRPNHRLGNQLLLTPLVQEVIATFPNCKIDLFVKGGVAYPIFENYKNIDRIIQLPKKPFSHLISYALKWGSLKKHEYDLVINGDKNSSSGRLSTQLAKSKYKVFGEVDDSIQDTFEDYEHIAKYPVYNLRNYLSKIGFPDNTNPIFTLNIKLKDTEVANGKTILKDIVKNNKPTICIYTNATGDKCYDETWWTAFYERLKTEYSEYNIIELLPIENISKINFAAPTLYSKDVREMCALISNTAIFIAADNGVMHLASAAQIPTVGFFKVTNIKRYQPYGNNSIAINTNETNMNDWIASISNIIN